MIGIYYVKEPDTHLFKKAGQSIPASGSYQLLLGSRIHVDEATIIGGWAQASTVPKKAKKSSNLISKPGFVEMSRLSKKQILKVFYVDVGQGDGTLIEAEGKIIIIDGGPSRGFSDKLNQRLEDFKTADDAAGLPKRTTLHIDIVVVSHFDKDHYVGLTRLLKNPNYTFGKLYHNGLPRYGENDGKDLHLGTFKNLPDGTKAISTDLTDLESGLSLISSGKLKTEKGNLNFFGKFIEALGIAHSQGRLGGIERLVRRKVSDGTMMLPGTGSDLKFEVLGPISTSETGPIRLQAFADPHGSPSPTESHTINGNSIVLKLTYGSCSFLFGGDLNEPAQKHLMRKYGNLSNFKVDVNKACHHGSSDFHIDYVKAVKPHATVFSSGDDGSYDHPLPDAMGTAARHSRGVFPLIFSTELARESGSKGIKFGHINARCNGKVTVMAQKKEKPSSKQTWYTFQLPYKGPFN